MFKKLLFSLFTFTLTFSLMMSPTFAQDFNLEFDDSQIFEMLPWQSFEEFEYNINSDSYQIESTGRSIIATAIAILGGIGLTIFLAVSLFSYIYMAWSLMLIAQKLKVDSEWMAWIPFLNLYLLFKCANLNPWLALLMLVPFVNLILGVYVVMQIAQRRGFPIWIGILSIVPFVNIIIPGVLAFTEAPKK